MEHKFSYDYFKKSADYILSKAGFKPDIAIVIGSTLNAVADCIENPVTIDYEDIPNFLRSTVKSHAGKLILGKILDKNVVCMSGRFHYYEGYDFEQLVIPIRVLKLLGVSTVILTNAAGAVNTDYAPGDIMLIKDHINLAGASPTRGNNVDEFGTRFFDTTNTYTKDLRELAWKCAESLGISLREGCYFFYVGPQFETPAEIRAARVLGADVVGMSTVTEALTATHCNMKVLAFSVVTNMAAGIQGRPVNGDEITETGAKVTHRLSSLIVETIKNIDLSGECKIG